MIENIKAYLSQKDEILRAIVATTPLLEIESTQNVFHDLVGCVVEQQIHYRSSKKVFQKMLRAANIEELTVVNFPIFEELGLAQRKLSMRKYKTLERVVDFFTKNKLDWSGLSDTEVRQQLVQIKGIGSWTIDMILLYTLQRPNIFPADDYHLKLAMSQQYKIDTSAKVKAQLKAIAKNWTPYQSYGVRYLLTWKTLQKQR